MKTQEDLAAFCERSCCPRRLCASGAQYCFLHVGIAAEGDVGQRFACKWRVTCEAVVVPFNQGDLDEESGDPLWSDAFR